MIGYCYAIKDNPRSDFAATYSLKKPVVWESLYPVLLYQVKFCGRAREKGDNWGLGEGVAL